MILDKAYLSWEGFSAEKPIGVPGYMRLGSPGVTGRRIGTSLARVVMWQVSHVDLCIAGLTACAPKAGPADLIDPADIPRFRALGVAANFEALWANGDEYLTKLNEPALGPARSRWLYPIASVVRTGAVVTGGSDWSVSSLNPLEAIEVGITHRNPGDTIAKPWNPTERVDLPTMIELYTINAAWALHQDKETGSIEVGKLADLVVLDRNLFEIAANRLHEARVIRTVLEGKTVYEAERR